MASLAGTGMRLEAIDFLPLVKFIKDLVLDKIVGGATFHSLRFPFLYLDFALWGIVFSSVLFSSYPLLETCFQEIRRKTHTNEQLLKL